MLKFFNTRQHALWAYGGAATLVAGMLANTYILLLLNEWRVGFWDSMQQAMAGNGSTDELYAKLLGFFAIVMPGVFLYAFNSWFTSRYVFQWRSSIVAHYTSMWDRISHIEGASQRIQEDSAKLAEKAEDIGSRGLQSALNIIAFIPVLAALSASVPELPLIGKVSYSLLWAAAAWSLFGTLLMAVVGRKLPGLNFRNQRVEAEFRKTLVLAEDGGPLTMGDVWDRIKANNLDLFNKYGVFNLWRGSYQQLDAIVLPLILIPTIATGRLTLGMFQSISTSFGAVTDGLQFLISSWTQVVELQSVVKRLRAFDEEIKHV